MSPKKMGRPPSENSLKDRINVRAGKDTIAKLEECAKAMNISRSEVIRQCIDRLHDDLKK